MSFFLRNIKNKRIGDQKSGGNKNKKQKIKKKGKDKGLNEIISSDSELSDFEDKKKDYPSEDEGETAQDKRLRLAKQYLEEIERQEKERTEKLEVDKDAIRHRLKEDVLEQAGRLQRKVADEYESINHDNVKILRGHKHPLTCLAISPDNKFIYSSSKDCSIIKWDATNAKRLQTIKNVKKGDDSAKGHSDHVLALAISSDNKFLCSGCKNKVIHVWNPENLQHVHTFKGHRDAISGLSFQKGTHTLFSSSFDRSVKIWNLDEMSYVETLFGHQDIITSVDSLSRERAITSGGRDNSIRVWKVVEESQLVFNGHISNIECVRLINEENFVSCGDDGILSLWSVMKKKPSCTIKAAHGIDQTNQQPYWITSIAALQNTDLIASGSMDGFIRFWKCGENFRSLTPLFTFPQVGFINAMQFSNDGEHLVVAVGQEHRLGRWWRIKNAKNSILIIPLHKRKSNIKK